MIRFRRLFQLFLLGFVLFYGTEAAATMFDPVEKIESVKRMLNSKEVQNFELDKVVINGFKSIFGIDQDEKKQYAAPANNATNAPATANMPPPKPSSFLGSFFIAILMFVGVIGFVVLLFFD